MGFGPAFLRNKNKNLSDADLAFLRAPENREFAETLNINSNYLFPEPVSGGRGMGPARRTGPIYSGIDKDKLESIQSAITGQKALIEGRKFFAPREAQTVNPLVLEALQRSMAQQPMLAGFEPQMAQMAQLPQFQQTAQPSFAQPQIGGAQSGLLGSLATKGQQQIAAGQAMNPTILKAKSV
tara:strand:- start:1337 stop:1882 length:546 start_codon:yes stop_codon:yes gene_type:complete